MKHILFALLFVISTVLAGDPKPEQKFKVTYTITYNDMTLADASKKEIFLKELLKDACGIEVTVEKAERMVNNGGIHWGITDSITYRSIPLIRVDTIKGGNISK